MGDLVLKIKNYQIIKDASLRFEPGLNVIVGESNNGKTAILRAIETAIFNLSRPEHITLGETVSAVGLQYNGHTIIWRRDSEAPSPMSYKIDGQLYSKLGRGQPEVVAKLLGIEEIELEEIKMRLNFQKQMAFPFLLDKTPSQMFKFIVQSGEDGVMDVIGDMKTDLNVLYSDIKSFDAARDQLKIAGSKELTQYNKKKEKLSICDEVLDLEKQVRRYQSLSTLTEQSNLLNGDIYKISMGLLILNLRLDVIGKLVNEEDRLLQALQLKSLISDTIDSRQKVAKIEIDLNSINSLLDLIGNVDNLKVLIQETENKQSYFNSLKVIIEDISQLKCLSKDIETRLENIPEVDLTDLRLAIEGYEQLKLLWDEANIKLKDSLQYGLELDRLGKELEEVKESLKEFEVCPFCGSTIMEGEESGCC